MLCTWTTAVILVLVLSVKGQASAVECKYIHNNNTVECGIGPETSEHDVPWLNLYKVADNINGSTTLAETAPTIPDMPPRNNWDYYSKIPESDCRNLFGLHLGNVSLGCITVPDDACYAKLYNAIVGNKEEVPVKTCKNGIDNGIAQCTKALPWNECFSEELILVVVTLMLV